MTTQRLYDPHDVPVALRPIFEQLRQVFPKREVWIQLENFDRRWSVVVIDRSNGTESRPILLRDIKFERTQSLLRSELDAIRLHLESAARTVPSARVEPA